jgi:cyclopropane fatty-acyl-phospholipid synthase-like methyltransferase
MGQNESGWERFFDEHAARYMRNVFVKNTIDEVDFLLEQLAVVPGGTILDIGCGTGRHCVELARRGYKVTGVDMSAGMLAKAEEAAEEAGVKVRWIKRDATQFVSDQQYDAAICLCEGAFSLLNLDDDPIGHDLTILQNIHSALKPGTGLLLTALNGLRKIRQYTEKDVANGKFDPLTITDVFEMEEGGISVTVKERGYAPSELTLLCRMAGFEVQNVWGGTAGNWGKRSPELDEIELMALAWREQG